MKRILLTAMASIALLISSCGKSDDSSGDITGIWQKESETVNGQSQTINECEKKSAIAFTQNQITFHDFSDRPGFCRYTKQLLTYKIEGNAIKSNEDASISFPFSVSGNTLTIESVHGQEKTILKYRKITQTELDAILATANNNNGGGNKIRIGKDEFFSFSLSGNTLTFEVIGKGKKTIYKLKKITQAELDAILATVNNGGN